MKLKIISPLLLVTGLLLSASGSSYANDNSNANTTDGTIIQDDARLLASQCFQCHGTDGVSQTDIDGLAGESERELIKEMLKMQRKNKNKLMTYQAHGYSEAQVRAIAAYIAGLPGSKSGGDSDSDKKEKDND